MAILIPSKQQNTTEDKVKLLDKLMSYTPIPLPENRYDSSGKQIIEDVVGPGQTEADQPNFFPKMQPRPRETFSKSYFEPLKAVIPEKTAPPSDFFNQKLRRLNAINSYDKARQKAEDYQKARQASVFNQNLQELRSTAIQRGSMPSQEVLAQHEKNMAMLRSGAKTVGEKGAAASAIARGEDPSEAIQRYQESKRMWSGMSRDDKQRLREIMAQTGSREDIAKIGAGARTDVARIGAEASQYRADVAAETQRQANEIKQQGVDNTAEYRRALLDQTSNLAQRKDGLARFLSSADYANKAALMQQNQSFMREIADAKNAVERERIGVARDVAKSNFADKASQFVLQLYGQQAGDALKTLTLQLKAKELGYKDLADKVGETMAGIAQSIANDELLGSMLDVKLKQAQSFSIPVPNQQVAPQPQAQPAQTQPTAQGAAPALSKGTIVKSKTDNKSYQYNGDGTFTDVASGLRVRLAGGIATAVQ